MPSRPALPRPPAPLYSAEERPRRDASVWTLVQGVLAPVQFLVFLVSLVLVLRYLATGAGRAGGHGLGRRQDAAALHHHDHRLHLGEGGLRPLPVRAGLLLGRRVQHAGAGAAHRLPRGAVRPTALDAARADAAGAGRLRGLRDQRRAVPAEAARGAAASRRADGALAAGSAAHERGRSRCAAEPAPAAAAAHRCCASAASARCSAA